MDAMDQLPDYMKMCFLALLNSINDMAYTVLKEQGLHIVKYLKKAVLVHNFFPLNSLPNLLLYFVFVPHIS